MLFSNCLTSLGVGFDLRSQDVRPGYNLYQSNLVLVEKKMICHNQQIMMKRTSTNQELGQ